MMGPALSPGAHEPERRPIMEWPEETALDLLAMIEG